MRFWRHETFFRLWLALPLIILSGCVSENQVVADAEAVCDAFNAEFLRSKYEGMWLADVEMEVYGALAENVKSDKVKDVIAARSYIDNYADVYPAVKEGLEHVLETTWNCPDMASFYNIDFAPHLTPAQVGPSVVELRQVDRMLFSMDEVVIDFSNARSAASTIVDNFGKPETVTIYLSEDSQDALPGLLEVMGEVGVTTVRTVTTTDQAR